ncbi:outer membrane protein assembly factor BamB [Celerinatantimonas sp. YJH-8]|uniref:outer membrane protein assembly factor BamB n=1 Tax=Celerinatantimonas sp. YJH-8 TaxID=3228714 RepID=UPI0038C95B36
MKKMYQVIVAVGLLLGLVACSSDKPVHTPAPTPEFKNQFHPQKLWEVSIGDGVGNYYSQLRPVVDDQHVYAADRAGTVAAFDLQGKRIWRNDLTDLPDSKQYTKDSSLRISGGLLAANQMIYLGTENADFFALDAATGKLKWHQSMPGEVIAAPTFSSGNLYVITNSGHLLSMDATTGRIQWNISLDQPALTLRGKAVPVVTNGIIILGRSNGSVSIFSQESGQQLFSSQLAISGGTTQLEQLVDADSQPVVVGSELYAVAYNGSLVAINLQDGQRVWRRTYSAYQDIAVSGGEIFMTDSRSHVIDVDRFSGQPKWQLSALQYRNVTAPAVDGDYVLVGDQKGYLYWINRDTGTFVSKLELDSDGLYIAPLVTENEIIIQTRSGKLIAFKRA